MSEIETPENPDNNSGMEPETDNTPRSGGSEAAKYRTRLREVEAERDTLAARLEASQRANVTQAIGGRFASSADFWNGTELSELLDDDGNVDSLKVSNRAGEILAENPHYASKRRTGPVIPQDGKYVTAPSPSSWQSAIGSAIGRG